MQIWACRPANAFAQDLMAQMQVSQRMAGGSLNQVTLKYERGRDTIQSQQYRESAIPPLLLSLMGYLRL